MLVFDHAHPRFGARTAVVGLVAGLVAGLAIPLVSPERALAAVPTFTKEFVGPSVAKMYSSGGAYDAVNNRLVLADTGGNRILFYSTTGVFQGSFGKHGTGPREFAAPRDVAVDESGNIYVADAENDRVLAFDSSGNPLWANPPGGEGPCATCLNQPIGVSWDPLGDQVLVASTGQHLIKAFNLQGNFLGQSKLGTSLGAGNTFTAPRDVTRGPDGRYWVTAYKEHQIKAYDWTPSTTSTASWDPVPKVVLGTGTNQPTDPASLNFPYNVAFSSSGQRAYVSDTGHGRIAIFDLSTGAAVPPALPPLGGKCVEHPLPCADPPAGFGEFNHLRRVILDGQGNVYGDDFWGNGLEVWSSTGTWLRSIEGKTAAAAGVAQAFGVDVAPNGDVYVLDRLNHQVERYTADGTFVRAEGARGDGSVDAFAFSWPENLAVAPNGRVWVLDTRGSETGAKLMSWPADLDPADIKTYQSGTPESSLSQMNYPSGIDVAPNGDVWIADTRNDRILSFNPGTEVFKSFGSEGTGALEFEKPQGIAVSSAGIYVADTGNNRVVKLSTDAGSQLASFPGLNGPEGLDLAGDGTVWVADSMNDKVVHLSGNLTAYLGDGFGSPGTGDLQFDQPHDVAVDGDKLLVADTFNNRVQQYAITGTPPAGFQPTYSSQISAAGGHAPLYPAGVAIATDGSWFVADSGGSSVERVNPATGAVTTINSADFTDPRDLEFDAADPTALWVANTGGRSATSTTTSYLKKISRTGVVLDELDNSVVNLKQPYGLANDTNRVYVANTYGLNGVGAALGNVKAINKVTGAVAWAQASCYSKAFSRPRDVGVADSGNVLVADTDNNRIVVLDADTGACLDQFGTAGSAPGQLKAPRSVTADGAGGMWVAESGNNRVQHLSASGQSLGLSNPAATGYGTGDEQFRSAHCVARIPGSTQIAVCDTFNFRLKVYNVNAAGVPAFNKVVGGVKPTRGGFNGAFAVAYGPTGDMYAVDWFNHRIQHFDSKGRFVKQFGGYGSGEGSLIFPRGILVDPVSGNVVVTDSENSRIDRFTSDGVFINSIKPTSGTPLSRPHQTALDGTGGYWIADTLNSRVIHLSAAGVVLGGFPVPGVGTVPSKPQGIALDTNGTLLVSNTENNKVERYGADGQLLGVVASSGSTAGKVNTPTGLLVTGSGTSKKIWIADRGNNRVVVLDSTGAPLTTFGTAGSGAGQLIKPQGVAVDPRDGDIVVADNGNDRLSLWSSSAARPRWKVQYLAPINAGKWVNRAEAGRAVPFRFSVSDVNGAVTDVAVARTKFVAHRCKQPAKLDRIERYASSPSGLVYRGAGDYRLNVKTLRRWAGTCRTLRINLGDGIWRDTEFKFGR